MIRHQAIRPDLNIMFLAAFKGKIEVKLIIGFLEERELSTIAALGDVMRDARRNYARKTCHDSLHFITLNYKNIKSAAMTLQKMTAVDNLFVCPIK